MAPDPIVDRFPKRSSSDDWSIGHSSFSLSRPPSDEDFTRFLGSLCRLDSDGVASEDVDDCAERAHSEERAAAGDPSRGPRAVPLRRWIEREAGLAGREHRDPRDRIESRNAAILRKLRVGFAVGSLLRVASRAEAVAGASFADLEAMCAVDNFVLELESRGVCETGCEVQGVVMVAPFSSLRFGEASSSISNVDDGSESRLGREVVAELVCRLDTSVDRSAAEDSSDVNMTLCYLFGSLLHFLFAGTPNQALPTPDDDAAVCMEEPLSKKKSSDIFERNHAQPRPVKRPSEESPFVGGTSFSRALSIVGDQEEIDNGRSEEVRTTAALTPLIDLGFPFSLSQLVRNLIDCGLGLFRPDDSYPSLDVAISDMQLLLQRPNRFLWNQYTETPQSCNLFIDNAKLYGRSQEVALLTDAFCRVSCVGRSEAVFVGGFSGCGKSRLVHSIFDSVTVVGGFAVTRKFDEMNSSTPLNVVLSAFNELCILVARRSSQEDLIGIHEKLIGSIGNSIMLLTGVLPNVIDLFPSRVSLPFAQSQVGMNFDGLCFAVQCLMRAISSPSQPVLLFLDDLQWADDLSLKLLQYVLSDIMGINCILFVGGFRENEIGQDHVLHDLLNAMYTSNVISSVIHLDGIGSNDVNSLISDTLGMFPRLCKGLSDVVFRKTNGNPFFTLEFLRSLITRGLVQYSFRHKCWKWNLNQISEENITENVLQLLKKKIDVLTESNQTALKVASCFGSSISTAVVQKLSSTLQYSNLQETLDEMGVKEGFVDFDGTTYRFVHDNVREAAYGLIADKEQYHLDLGMALQLTGNDEVIAAIQQINRSSPLLVKDEIQRASIANLGYEAGIKAISFFDFAAAFSYFETAVTFLPTDSWTVLYDLTLKCNFQLAKAAYSRGWLDESKQICNQIIECGKCLEDILETYALLVSLSCARKDLPLAFNSCLKVLDLLGEEMPADTVDVNELLSLTTRTKSLFQSLSNQDFLDMPEGKCTKKLAVMEFSEQLTIVSFYLKPKLCQYYSVRRAFFCIRNRLVCKYTPGAFVSFASVLSQQGLGEDMRLACRIGKLGMIMLNRNENALDQVPGVYEVYFTWVGILTEPIQAQVAMCQHAHEIGLQSGNLLQAGLILGTIVARSIYAGKNLRELKKEIELHLKSAKQRSQQLLHSHLSIEYQVVTRLIGDETLECSSELESESPVLDVLKFTLEMMASFYVGHPERVHHKSKLWDGFSDFHRWKVPLGSIYAAFFSGLASFQLYARGKVKSQRHMKMLTKSMSILEKASHFSEWNFKNKHLLLKAAYLTATGKNILAEEVFNDAILASRASKFVHEEGLACELAAMHQAKQGNKTSALSFLRQAASCYKMWGSNVKEAQVLRLITSIEE